MHFHHKKKHGHGSETNLYFFFQSTKNHIAKKQREFQSFLKKIATTQLFNEFYFHYLKTVS